MATHRHIDAVCVVITVFTLLLTVLFMNGSALGIQAVSDEENSDAMFTQNDLNADWDISGATKITLSDKSSTVAATELMSMAGTCILFTRENICFRVIFPTARSSSKRTATTKFG